MTSDVHRIVRDRYAAAAVRAQQEGSTSCCESGCCPDDPISRDLYSAEETAAVPDGAVVASLGCGNPTALAALHPGEVVLDLGSGGGIDVLLSARRVGPSGHAYGVDMTDEMLELARANAAAAGATNVTFLQGTIEDIPLPDASVDVVISNCVINLSGDKATVLREAFRVLRPGGRFAVSDIVACRELPPDLRRSAELWTGCIAGALSESEFLRLLEAAGFVGASLEVTRRYTAEDATAALAEAGMDTSRADEVDGALASAFVRATKPLPVLDEPGACCTPPTAPPLDLADAQRLAEQLRALADPMRLQLLSLVMACDSACICDLTAPVGLSQPTVSHHMRILVDAGLLTREKRGRWAHYSVVPEAFTSLAGRIADPHRGLRTP